MISDPLKIRSNKFYSEKLLSWLKNHPGEECFFDHHRKSGERWIGILNGDEHEVWWTNIRDKKFNIPGYDINATGSTVEKEKFFEFLSAKYPDHLEWFLFHPELF